MPPNIQIYKLMEERIAQLEKKVDDLEVLFKSLNDVMSTFIRTELEILSNRFGDKKE